MINKTIGHTSAALLTELHQKGLDFFETEQVSSILCDNHEAAIRRLLSDMVGRGLLMRLRGGIYHITRSHEVRTSFVQKFETVERW